MFIDKFIKKMKVLSPSAFSCSRDHLVLATWNAKAAEEGGFGIAAQGAIAN